MIINRERHLHDHWVEEFLKGNSSMAKQIYDSYCRRMMATVYRILGNKEESEDVLQDGFVKVFTKLHTYRKDASLATWISRIMINTALERLRKQKIKIEEINENSDFIDEPTWDSQEINAAMINAAIDALPQGSRIVFSLYLLEGLPHKEIAQRLGISESTSKTQYMRAKALVKEQLKSKRYA